MRVAIIGMACRYPDAKTPTELWENALSQRRAFRRMPDERTRLADYFSPDRAVPDRFYAPNAALIEGYEFDRVRFRIAGSTYRSTDLTHWLALDVASQALADAGFPDGAGLPRKSTAVIMGNTLTGEFTRANVMRLRWPYVQRTVAQTLHELGWDDAQRASILGALEKTYKAPFPAVDEDTLAGGLSNTIAGRICNYFDLGGGGYTVDGACSSSLLSVTHACKALVDGDADIAVAGGVDLSLDPFELVGFAKTGALAQDEMRVYDRRSAGFWPGEGCGVLVLAREDDARARGDRIYALIPGWGISSDGKGGITRPEVDGQRLAMERAYTRAGFGPDTVGYFEGHGTGTPVGDACEIQAISAVRLAANASATRAVLGSIKANIGHTKAAAGVAGLIKATMAIHQQMIPPATGCADPNPGLNGPGSAVRVTGSPEAWPVDQPIRAGVSSMGFGGINTHVALEHPGSPRRTEPQARVRALARSAQDAELLLFDASSLAELREKVVATAELVSQLAYAELADLAARLQAEVEGRPVRAAVVAASPGVAGQRLTKLSELIEAGAQNVFDANGIFCGNGVRVPRIVFAFPGQGSGRSTSDSAVRRRFDDVDRFLSAQVLPVAENPVATEVVQPHVAASSAGALLALQQLGISAEVALGHSLGELTALHWAGVMDDATLVRIAAERGRIMAGTSREAGAMASIEATSVETAPLLGERPVVIAGLNAPRQTVVSGPAAAVAEVIADAERAGLRATRLPVSHAFHSPLVAEAAGTFAEFIGTQQFKPLRNRVVSTVTGAELVADADLVELLERQITEPVRFVEAVTEAAVDADLIIEVGPGHVLSGLVRETVPVPVVAMDSDSPSIEGLLRVAAAAYALGAPVRHAGLFEGRHVKQLPNPIRLFANPCETGVSDEVIPVPDVVAPQPVEPEGKAGDGLDLIRGLAAERAELPVESVHPDSRLLDELHLSSITVGQIVNDAIRVLGLPQPAAPLNFATATVREIAEAVAELAGDPDSSASEQVVGVVPWIRAFQIELIEEPLVPSGSSSESGSWQLFAPHGHPIAEQLRDELQAAGVGGGVLACPSDVDPDLELVLAAAKTTPAERFVLVHHGATGGGAAMAKTLFLETGVTTCVIDAPPIRQAVPWIVAEVSAATGFAEIHYDATGTRRRPVLQPVPERTGPRELPLSEQDVLLVTGGGKGITAECALNLAVETGARVALLGRSDPAQDTELAANLDRFAAAGVDFRYLRADVTVGSDVHAAVASVQAAFGTITAVLHGAGRNVPRKLADLDEQELRETLAPKIGGLHAVLDAVDPKALRLLVTFGSIIGRAGLAGEAHYAAANAAVTEATVRFGGQYPDCRCLALEWSVWSGVGMGERLGVVESLRRNGITPISTDEGLALFRELLANPGTPDVLVVTGRLTGMPTVEVRRRELPLLRFVDRVLVDHPDIELVTEAELTTETDPYLADHILDGDQLFPAVLGMEAMAQAAAAVTGQDCIPAIEDAEFRRPIVVPAHGSTTIRVAALVRSPMTVEVVVRSSETGFQVDHFRAICRFPRSDPDTDQVAPANLPRVPLDPASELYGGPLFQGRRFQRLLGYRQLSATQYVVDVAGVEGEEWFGMFLPGRVLLGDPGARDVFMQAVQGCRPDQLLLPVRIDRVLPTGLGEADAKRLTVTGVERVRESDAIVWDVTVRDDAGKVIELWEGLRLQVIRSHGGLWPVPLFGPYLERHVGDTLRIVVEPQGDADRPQQTNTVVSRVLGREITVRHRPDGKPEVPGGHEVSVAHGAGLTVAVAGEQATCDVEPIVSRSEQEWRALLGADRYALAQLLEREHHEDLAVAATRLWCASECVQKAGRPVEEPITLLKYEPSGWALFRAGDARVATYSSTARQVVFAVRGGS
ncbi:enediyne polyketide synthase [Kibdelosporangium banguiense]|uniref:Enediyne polyketide synthase n=1 Tax=Kibdelosporangium banguiense TaxID=1365924 RepID=A0ABS4TU49_9PSEU|nr:type I polyketide synthase [Kibdelosporangium banguiense]MBP2327914.1 enediyne polyketide synthase [Kibdelosporangium banguiense]